MDAEVAPLTRTRTRPTRRLLAVQVMGLAVWSAGTGVAAGYVVIVAALLVATGPWAFVAARRAARSIRVVRRLPERATAGHPATVRLEASASGSAAMVVHDTTLDAVGVIDDPRPGGVVEGTVVLRRGRVGGGTVRVEAADPFGLFRVTAEGDAGGLALIVPDEAVVDRADLSSSWAVEAGDRASRTGGGPEVVGTRDYQFGDAARTVHWRSSARRDQLVVRQYAEESRPDVRLDIGPGDWDRAALDRVGEAVTGIARDARHHGHVVRVAADGQVHLWADDVREVLAGLPPAGGIAARPLEPNVGSDAAITVTFDPTGDGARVAVERGGDRLVLGDLPGDGDAVATATWLRTALGTS